MNKEALDILRDQIALAKEQGRNIEYAADTGRITVVLDPKIPVERDALESVVHVLAEPPTRAENLIATADLHAWLTDHEDCDDREILEAFVKRWEHKARMFDLLRAMSARYRAEGYRACAAELHAALGEKL